MRALALLLLLSAATASAQVTKTTTMVTVPNCGNAPATSAVDVYRPAGAGPFPIVALGHGFQNSKDNFAGLAQALGALGIVVVVPQFPLLTSLSACWQDHARNAKVMLAAIDQQVTAGGIDTTKQAVGGHSAGGLSAFLAAAQRPMAAVMLFDAVDNNTLGATAAPMVSAPMLLLQAEPSSCNTQNNSAGWFTAVTGPKAKLKVVNAKHCDPQEPISSTCSAGCGGQDMASVTRQAVFKRYGVAFFNRYLKGVTMPCLEATAQADAMAGTVTAVDFQLGGCGGSDAGTVVPDAGNPVVDAGQPGADAGAATDAGVVVVDAGTAEDAGSAEFDAGAATGGGAGGGGQAAGGGGGTPAQGGGSAGGSSATDAGVDDMTPAPGGCGCTAADPWALVAAVSVVLALRRRRDRA